MATDHLIKYQGIIDITPELSKETLQFVKEYLLLLEEINHKVTNSSDYRKEILNLLGSYFPVKLLDHKTIINHFVSVSFSAKIIKIEKDKIIINSEFHNKLMLRQHLAHLVDFIFKKNSYCQQLGMLVNSKGHKLNGLINGINLEGETWQYRVKNNLVIKFEDGEEIITDTWINKSNFVRDIIEYGKIVSVLPQKDKINNKKIKI